MKSLKFLLPLFALLMANALQAANVNPGSVPVFGQNLFGPDRAETQFSGFNPNYQIAVGDRIALHTWGALAFNEVLMVDAQGNIFIPEVGPVNVLGVQNQRLNQHIEDRVKQVYRENVGLYANLEASQPVQVYVSGFVEKPGLYGGLASDSILNYLNKAGGIDFKRGSLRDIRVMRQDRLTAEIDLYEFLLHGKLPTTQLHDGDVIFVGPIQHVVQVTGEVLRPYQFEFTEEPIPAVRALDYAHPSARATHVVVQRRTGVQSETEFHPLEDLNDVSLQPTDQVIVDADRTQGTILVRIEGEHIGTRHEVLPYGARLSDVARRLKLSERSRSDALRLYRSSVAQRQREMLNQSLDRLEQSLLSARSVSAEEAQIRSSEAEMLLQFVDRARDLEPTGQVVLSSGQDWNSIYLEEGDRIVIPSDTNTVMVHGEVFFPNTQIFKDRDSLRAYIERAGGFTPNADRRNVIVMRINGEIERTSMRFGSGGVRLNPGDEIFILPRVDTKFLAIARDLTQILYNVAISTKVVLDL